MPCWKITSGQPLAGLTRPDAALGTVISTGTRTVPVATGRVLRKVRHVDGLFGPHAPAHDGMVPQAAPFQNVFSGAGGLAPRGAVRWYGRSIKPTTLSAIGGSRSATASWRGRTCDAG